MDRFKISKSASNMLKLNPNAEWTPHQIIIINDEILFMLGLRETANIKYYFRME